jgi:RHS repeat-associated protein
MEGGTQTVAYDGGGDGLVSNPFAFKADVDDTATGMVEFGQRWYDPYIGAWTQQDGLVKFGQRCMTPTSARGPARHYRPRQRKWPRLRRKRSHQGSDPTGNSSVPGCTFAVIGPIRGFAGVTLLASETLGATIAAGVVVVSGAFTASGAITIDRVP